MNDIDTAALDEATRRFEGAMTCLGALGVHEIGIPTGLLEQLDAASAPARGALAYPTTTTLTYAVRA